MATKTKSPSKAPNPKKRNPLPLLAAVLALCAVAVIAWQSGWLGGQESTASGPVALAEGDTLKIPVAQITEEASFFPVTVDGTEMEVLAIRASDGTVRTAFNTCQSCYTSGAGFYTMQEGALVCNNCGFHFSPDEVEVASGGCNPWPIFDENKTVTEDTIEIPYDFLASSRQIFARWKTAVR